MKLVFKAIVTTLITASCGQTAGFASVPYGGNESTNKSYIFENLTYELPKEAADIEIKNSDYDSRRVRWFIFRHKKATLTPRVDLLMYHNVCASAWALINELQDEASQQNHVFTQFQEIKGKNLGGFYFDFTTKRTPGKESLVVLQSLHSQNNGSCLVLKIFTEKTQTDFTSVESFNGRLGSGLLSTVIQSVTNTGKIQ